MNTANSKQGTLGSLLKTLCALALGFAVGVVAHYLVYRLSLPSSPFIYVAF